MTALFRIKGVRKELVLGQEAVGTIDEMSPTKGAANKRMTERTREGYDCELFECTVNPKFGKKELLALMWAHDPDCFSEQSSIRVVEGTAKGKAAALKPPMSQAAE